MVQAGADWWVLVEASLRYACSPANRKSPFTGVGAAGVLVAFLVLPKFD